MTDWKTVALLAALWLSGAVSGALIHALMR